MYNVITVSPSDGHFCFNVKYCTQRISVPGFFCELGEPEKMIIPLKELGCSDTQIESILFMIHNSQEGEVDENGNIVKEEEYYEEVKEYEDEDKEEYKEEYDVKEMCEAEVKEYDPEDDVDGDNHWD